MTTGSAANIKMVLVWLEHLCQAFEVESTHLAWGAELRSAESSTGEVSLYTLADRQIVESTGNEWEWQCRGLYQGETGSGWLPEKEVRDGFDSIQLDVFHAL